MAKRRTPPDLRKAEFIRLVAAGERESELINEAKAGTWESEVEHALVVVAGLGRVLIKGGRKGITFDRSIGGENETLGMRIRGRSAIIERIEWHTHPVATGPSDGDRDAIRILGQAESRVYELGGDPDGTVFGPDKGRPSRPGKGRRSS